MPYIINKFNGTQLTVVADGTVNSSLDLKLIGKNYAGYGEMQNENFVFLLENFANTVAPSKAITGQIWFDSNLNKLKVMGSDNAWHIIGGSDTSTEAPTTMTLGDLWFDTSDETLYIFNGTTFIPVGADGIGDVVVPITQGGSGATNAVDALINLGAQTILVSGVNIKTINGNSLLGTGNLLIDTNVGAASGSGLFNTNISATAGYAISSSMATAYTASNSSGYRYIIHSIHVTNIDGVSSADVSGQFSGTTYSSIAFCNTVPVPAGSSVELLKKPKVLQPNDLIQLQASADNALHCTITIEALADTALFGTGIDITDAASYTTLHTATANSVIESVLLVNDDGVSDIQARVVWTDGSNNIQGYYAYNMIVPADSTVEIMEQPKFLPNGYKVRVYSDAANRLEAIISGKSITA